MSFYTNVRIRLATDAKKIQTKTGTAMSSAFGYINTEGEEGFAVGLIAFNKLAEKLLTAKKGDTLAVMGKLQSNDYEKDGVKRKGYQIVCDAILSVKKASPSFQEPRQKKQFTPENAQAAHKNFDQLNDEIGF